MTRQNFDYYPTPEWCVHALLEEWEPDAGYMGRWLEPCAGDGAIIRAFDSWYQKHPKTWHHEWDAIEIQQDREIIGRLAQAPSLSNYQTGWDFRLVTPPEPEDRYDCAITNPPFNIAMEIVQRSLLHANQIAMLLRLTFIESEEREDWLRNNPFDMYPLAKRPAYVNGGTDMVTSAWFIWPGENRIKILKTPREVSKFA